LDNFREQLRQRPSWEFWSQDECWCRACIKRLESETETVVRDPSLKALFLKFCR